jgi:hypothetical protein
MVHLNTTADELKFVRKLMGSPSDGTNGTPEEISPSELIDCLESAFEQIVLFTKKSNWSGSDTIINQVKMAEAYFCSSIGRSIWRDPDNKAQEHYNRAKGMCTAIMENQEMSSSDPPQGFSQTSVAYVHKTNTLNNTMKRYTSPRVDI